MTKWIESSVNRLGKWDKGAWQWHFLKAMIKEDLYDEDHGTHIGYTNMHAHKYGSAAYNYNAINYHFLISLNKNTAQYLLLLNASCCCFCQIQLVKDTDLKPSNDLLLLPTNVLPRGHMFLYCC
ncbi:hypothetical protein Lal_00039428 [Lupinus albus]|nr:hypothetical protein Lal_00039428 [Lupinus albus]